MMYRTIPVCKIYTVNQNCVHPSRFVSRVKAEKKKQVGKLLLRSGNPDWGPHFCLVKKNE